MKISCKGARSIAVMTTLAVSLLVGCSGSTPAPGASGSPAAVASGPMVKGVGSLEQELLFELPEFKEAKTKLDEMVKKEQAALEKKIPKGKRPTEEQARMIREGQLKVQQESAKLLNPLKQRAEAAISKVARDKGMLVVLDKHIVVYGVPDITDEVKKVFGSKEELKLPAELDTSKSPIGYFDQEVVRSLKIFQEVEVKEYQKRMELMKGVEARMKANPRMSPSEREVLEREFKLKMEAFHQQLMEPLVQKVTDSVKEVAQAESLSLVLDKQHVMQGGRNMTNEVVEAFLKRIGAPASKPKASATPGTTSVKATPSAVAATPSATPGAP